MDRIRNFSIIAHIDHGKSTLADRILEVTGAVDPKKMQAQMLDSMDLERERGITIKAQAVRVEYTAADGQTYHLHLIDTPGHVDFSYEVSRSLAACEGALLVVDAAQGVEAQTVANTYLAIENGLELIPVINKVDLPGAEPERVAREIADLLGGDPEEALRISAKTGEGVPEVLEAIVERIPAPKGEPEAPTRALIFDSEFDQYRGVIAYVRMVDGRFRKHERILAMQNGTEADIDDIGFFRPAMTGVEGMEAGDVGYLITGIKDVAKLRVGDTLTSRERPAARAAGGLPRGAADGLLRPLPDRHRPLRRPPRRAREAGPQRRRPVLGAGDLRGARLRLPLRLPRPPPHGDRARAAGARVRARPAGDDAERALRGAPRQRREQGGAQPHRPARTPGVIETIEEPYIRATVIAPKEQVGAVMELCQTRRGTHVDMHYLSPERVQIRYDMPLAEIVLDFFDLLKSSTRGYASLDYEPIGNRASDLVKVDILLAGDKVDALSIIVHREFAYDQGKRLVGRLRKTIPRQLFDVPVQAAIGSNILARETVKALRKDVTAKLYGGDVTRKNKLLKKQKAGKKRMKSVGRVEVPQEAFLAVLEIDE